MPGQREIGLIKYPFDEWQRPTCLFLDTRVLKQNEVFWFAFCFSVSFFFSFYIFLGVCGEGDMHTVSCMWSSEDNSQELVRFSHHVTSRDQTFVMRNHLYPPSHLTSPGVLIQWNKVSLCNFGWIGTHDVEQAGSTFSVNCVPQLPKC